ncbi:hypothetical protein HDF18_22250 [Mucilaginibacter sp. X5P1]|uniref:hypothetical protein n=1 Tax=Mucilaginibacter sp. X5P1 TaxID=2723088 RepID=UPI00161667C7|nr:hypothetical protein [Mucilaginibacter sp. X5P1]MBB6141000.1 hypothetical protein [Mucilaginibacter sp. X5P1]
MSKDLLDIFGLIANSAAILTAIIATIFYYKTQEKNYYLNDINGNYKIFSTLKDQDNKTALYHLEIKYVSSKGWFTGIIKYSELFKSPGSASAGLANVYGKVYYSPARTFIGFISRIIKFNSFNPLETSDISSFHGKLYLLSRNDLDVSIRDWKEMLVQEYSIIHYRDAQRIKLYNPKMSTTYLLIPDNIVLTNTDKIPDPVLDQEMGF